MTWKKRKPKWDWRSVLTDEEREFIDKADRLRVEWLQLQPQRTFIINRAIQRCRYREGAKD